MKDVFLHFAPPDKPVLILGKGKSLDFYKESMRKDYYVIGINQVLDVFPVDATFLIHSEHIPEPENTVILPYHPHIGKTPGPLDTHQNFYHYNLNTAPVFHALTPVITTDGFTIHALLNVLGLLGIRGVSTLGVDGGFGYSHLIDQEAKTDFDLQFPEFKKIENKFGMTISAMKPDTAHVG